MNPDVYAEKLAAIPDGPEAEELRRQLMKEKTEEEDRLRRERSAQMKAEYDRRVAAVLETAMAFYRRGIWQQYDSVSLTYAPTRHGAPGTRRSTDEFSPEEATENAIRYIVCSSFIYNVYYEAIGWRLCGEPDQCVCRYHYRPDDDTVVYRWSENDGETLAEAIESIKRLLRPGDIFTSGKQTEHTMLYLGDYFGDGTNYVIHSWGGKYKMATGKDTYETMGTLRIQPIEQLCFTEGNKPWYKENKIPRWSMYDGIHRAVILRPLRAFKEADYPLTSNAVARLQHPGLNIIRTADKGPYQTVQVGDRITYTVEVQNQSKQDYTGISITDKIPANTCFVEAADAIREGDILSWTVDIPAGGQVRVCWTVEAAQAGQIVAEGGQVAGIRSNRIVTQVASLLTARQQEALLELTAENTAARSQGLAFCNEIYRQQLGIDLQLPDTAALIGQLVEPFVYEGQEDSSICFRKDIPGKLKQLLIPRYCGGLQLIRTAYERILEFDLKYLMPGDILIYAKKALDKAADYRVYLYQGEGRFLCSTEAGITEHGEELLWPAFAEDFFVALRPSLGL